MLIQLELNPPYIYFELTWQLSIIVNLLMASFI
jgi:hypothetical protein